MPRALRKNRRRYRQRVRRERLMRVVYIFVATCARATPSPRHCRGNDDRRRTFAVNPDNFLVPVCPLDVQPNYPYRENIIMPPTRGSARKNWHEVSVLISLSLSLSFSRREPARRWTSSGADCPRNHPRESLTRVLRKGAARIKESRNRKSQFGSERWRRLRNSRGTFVNIESPSLWDLNFSRMRFDRLDPSRGTFAPCPPLLAALNELLLIRV